MTVEISELMDGELDSPAAETLVARISRDPVPREDWALYHLIGDTLRGAAYYSPGLAPEVSSRLAREPAVLAPRRGPTVSKATRWSLSAAASLAAVAVVAWIGLRGPAEPVPAQMATLAPAGTPIPQPAPAMTSAVNDYLVAHQEYSPRFAMQGMAPAVQTVAFPAEGAAR